MGQAKDKERIQHFAECMLYCWSFEKADSRVTTMTGSDSQSRGFLTHPELMSSSVSTITTYDTMYFIVHVVLYSDPRLEGHISGCVTPLKD